jgi:TolA-binding protein
MESIAGGDMGDDEEVDTEETANPIPEDMGAVVTKLQYRIEELEKKMQSMETIKEGGKAEKVKTEDLPGDPTKVNTVDKMAAVEPDEEEEELPKLDGAPIDENAPNKTGIKMNKKGAMVNPQNSFLSKLYK